MTTSILVQSVLDGLLLSLSSLGLLGCFYALESICAAADPQQRRVLLYSGKEGLVEVWIASQDKV